jgi:hypothetical protein
MRNEEAVPGLDWEAVMQVCRDTANMKWRYGRAAGLTKDELIHDLSSAVWEAHEKNPFDPSRGVKQRTWVMSILGFKTIDKVRSNTSRVRREQEGVEGLTEKQRGKEREYARCDGGGAIIPTFFENHSEPSEYFYVPRAENRRRGGRLGYPVRPMVNAVYEKGRRGMGWRSFHRELMTDPDLARDLGFGERVPCLRTLKGLARRLKEYRRSLRRRAMSSGLRE